MSEEADWERRAAAKALLDWYLDMGVDEAVSETPRGLTGQPIRVKRPAGRPGPRHAPSLFEGPSPRERVAGERAPAQPSSNSALPRPRASASDAEALANACETLDELKAAVAAFEGSDLRRTARNLVFDGGSPDGRVMLIGQGPGAEEDQQGVVFCGRSGHLLDKMLHAIGLDREDAYLANVVPYRPPGNRPPTSQEAATFKPFLDRQIVLAEPDVLVLLGAPAAKEVGGVSEGITKARGRWIEVTRGGRAVPTLVTLHPAYLLRTPIAKRQAWRDMMALKMRLRAV